MSSDSQYNEHYTSTIDDNLLEAQGRFKEHADQRPGKARRVALGCPYIVLLQA
jgi:hypothetical protein